MHKMVIFKSVPQLIQVKIPHVYNVGGKVRGGFCKDWGDVPCATFNEETKKFEAVENNRGAGYAGRNRKMHRNKKLYSRKNSRGHNEIWMPVLIRGEYWKPSKLAQH